MRLAQTRNTLEIAVSSHQINKVIRSPAAVAAMAVPIVCFDQAGGSQELVEEDGGFVVPYLDTLAMADRVLELASAPELRERLGNRVREKVIERNDAKVVMPLVVDLIGRMIAISNGPDENNTDDGH